MAQPLGVVDILVSGQPSEHRLPQHADQRMAAVLAGAGIGEHVTGHRAEAQGIVEFAIGQQPGIGGDPRTMELELQAAGESNLRVPSLDSPAGFSMMASCGPGQTPDIYTLIVESLPEISVSSGECGIIKNDFHAFTSLGVAKGVRNEKQQKRALISNISNAIEKIDTDDFGIRVILVKTKE
jgi:hypothetical protein